MQQDGFYKKSWWRIRSCFSFKGKRFVQTCIRINICFFLVLFSTPIVSKGQYWESLAGGPILSDEKGRLQPFRKIIPPVLKSKHMKSHKILIYRNDTLVETVYFDKYGVVRKINTRVINERSPLSTNSYVIYEDKYQMKRTTRYVDFEIYELKEDRVVDKRMRKGISFKINRNLIELSSSLNLGFILKEPLKATIYNVYPTYKGSNDYDSSLFEYKQIVQKDSINLCDIGRLFTNDIPATLNRHFFSTHPTFDSLQEFCNFNIPIDSLLRPFFTHGSYDSLHQLDYGFVFSLCDRSDDYKNYNVLSYLDSSGAIRGFEGNIDNIKLFFMSYPSFMGSVRKSLRGNIIEFKVPTNNYEVSTITLVMPAENIYKRSFKNSSHLDGLSGESLSNMYVSTKKYDYIFETGERYKRFWQMPKHLSNDSQVIIYEWKYKELSGFSRYNPEGWIRLSFNKSVFSFKVI